jgi:hypothetical protein
MGGFLGIGGSSSNTDRKNELQGFTNLNNLFNFGLNNSQALLGTGQQQVGQGVNALDTSLNYFKKLLSGNRTATAGAVAQPANAAQAMSDAAKNNRAAMGTARGGGTAAENTDAQDKVMEQIDNFLFGVKPVAAGQVASIGKDISGIGLGETSAALGFGDLAEQSTADATKIAAGSRPTDYQINQDMVNQVTGTISDVLAGIGF